MIGQRIFAVMNRKGGVGKTTTAINLAAGLARLNSKGHVLIVDLDPQANVSASLGMKIDGPTISDLLEDEAKVEEVCYRAGPEGGERGNLWILPASDDLQDTKEEMIIAYGIEEALRSRSSRDRKKRISSEPKTILSKTMEKAVRAFDFIVIDCPPSLDILRDAVYDFAKAAIVPVKPDYLGSAGTVRHTQNILDAQAAGYEIRIEMFVPTFYKSREILANQMLNSLRKKYGRHLVADPIPQAVVLERAPAAGKTIFEYAPGSKAADAYTDLAEKLYRKYVPKREVVNG